MRIAPILALLLPAAAALGQVTTRVSVDSTGGDANGVSAVPSVSDDGSRVAFYSSATDLVSGDTNGADDIFVRDLVTGANVRASVDSAGNQSKSTSRFPALSGDGTVVAFESDASNLVSGDTNGYRDVFVHDLVTGMTERVSVDSAGNEANWPCTGASISADGRYVAFQSIATNLVAGDTNGAADVFVHDRVTGVTERVDVDSSGVEADLGGNSGQISEDGSVVVFASPATNLVSGDTNFRVDIFVHDRTTGVTERVSVSTSGAEANLDCSYPAISGDGQIVAFVSQSTSFVAGTTSASSDVFVHDRTSGITFLASHDASGLEGNKSSIQPALSRSGRSLTSYSYASNLVAGDGNGRPDAFVYDLDFDFTDRVSVDSTGGDGNGDTLDSAISADGRFVVFMSRASNLVSGDGNSVFDVFERDRCSTEASWTNYGAGYAGTLGIPSLTAQADPEIGTTLTVDLSNSAGAATSGFLFIGFARTQIHWRGGDLLVLPTWTFPISIPVAGLSLPTDLPLDFRLDGLTLDVQAAEVDAGARRGISSTPGLELVLGC